MDRWRHQLRFVAGIALSVAGLTLWFWPSGRARVAAEAPQPLSAGSDSGATIWARDCAVCHGVEGQGSYQGPDISRSGTASVHFMVSTGRMPAPFRPSETVEHVGPTAQDRPRAPGRYSEAEIRRLVDYTRSFVSGPPAEPVPDLSAADLGRGGELYRNNCASCHQMAGSGGALAYGTNGPPLGQATAVQVIEAMRTGPGSMPVFSTSVIDDTEARDLAAYVQYLRKPQDRGGLGLGHLGPVPEGLVAWVLGIGGVVLLCRWLGERDRMLTD
jgi:ubiquinol-cytochrome c reductase cytochrome c subunit